MFKLFGKKPAKEPKPEPKAAPEKSPELAAFGAQFLPEETTILAVTGANGIGGEKNEGDGLWRVSIQLTAWMEEDEDGPAARECASLVALADDKLMEFLRRRVARDSIIRAKVRRNEENDCFLLVDIPEPAMEPELKAILEEQKKPVTVSDPELGVFTLDRTVNWFAAEVDWLGQSIQLTFDLGEDQAECVQAARALMNEQETWDRRVREYAAGELWTKADLQAQEGEESAEPVTQEGFAARIELESIQVYGNGAFEFWLHDGDLSWGRSIHISGSLAEGLTAAELEG